MSARNVDLSEEAVSVIPRTYALNVEARAQMCSGGTLNKCLTFLPSHVSLRVPQELPPSVSVTRR
jgi:hypothetical protein